MEFKSRHDLIDLLKLLKPLNYGSEGIIYYYPSTKKILKISNSFLSSYDFGIDKRNFDLSKFDGVENDTYVLPNELIYVDKNPVGIIYPYIKGNNLANLNPLKINLDTFENATEQARLDTHKLSKDKIKIYDMPYNTMLSEKSIKVIDTESYSKSEELEDKILSNNLSSLNISIKDFIVSSLFEEFIQSRKDLFDMYKDREINITMFLKEFRKYLSEYVGKNINTLDEANNARNKHRVESNYIRMLK